MNKQIGLFLVTVSFCILLLSIFRSQGGFINLGESVKNHLLLFSTCKIQYFLFYFVPLLLSVGLVLIYRVNAEFCENVNVIVSIILSMLFAVCGIIGTKDCNSLLLRHKEDINNEVLALSSRKTYEMAKAVAEETLNAIIFATMLSLILITISLGALVANIFVSNDIVLFIISAIIYYLLSVVLITMMLILKRMQKLFSVML